MKIYYEQVMLRHNSDWSGFTKLTSTEPTKRFYQTRTTDKTYYPSTSNDFKQDHPFEITIELSTTTQNLEQHVYMLTSLLIEIGGISRAFVKFGMIVAHLTAYHLYKTALIKDLFLVQSESKEPHPAYKSFLE